MARSLVDQLRPLMIAWLLLTLPVVCHHETAVVLLSAVAAGHEHQHMMAESSGQPRPASATHAHGANHAHADAAPAADSSLVVHPAPGTLAEWRAYQATPVSQGLPSAQDGVAFFVALDVLSPLGLDTPLPGPDRTAPDPERRAPPAPPPRALLG